MKKITSFILSLIVVISSCFFISDNSVTAYAADEKWDLKASYEADGEFSVDTAEKSGNGKYSIKIKNNDYGVSRVEKTFKVKPNTTYRATVMAKCVDYKKSSIRQKLYIMRAIILPIFILTLRKADYLAESLEVRQYNIHSNYFENRKNRWNRIDILMLLIHIFIFLILGVIL